MHTYHRTALFSVLALSVIANAAAHAHRHSPPPVEPPAPNPSTDDDIHWGLRTFIALISAGLACALSMSAGVGGGGILVPIFNVILGLSIKGSTGLSQAVIASSGIGVALFNLANPHPFFPHKPLVDFNLVLVLTPALLLGISFGVLANAVSPPWLITVAISIVLTYMAQRMLRLAIRMRNKERECEALEALRWSAEEAENGSDCALDSGGAPLARAISSLGQGARPKLPWTQIAQLVALWIVFAALDLGKSRHGRCTVPYAGLYLVQVAVALTATLYFVKRAVQTAAAAAEYLGGEEGTDAVPSIATPLLSSPEQQQQQRREEGAEDRGNATSPSSSLSKLTLTSSAGIAVGAGALAGLIGMGGGFLLNPLLLEIGIQAQVAAATSSLMVLFSSSSAAIAFAFDGRLDLPLAAVFGSVCCIFGFLGVTTLSKVVKKRGASAVVFLLAGVMTLGIVATLSFGGRRVWHEIAVVGKLPGFQPFCTHHHDSFGLVEIPW
ncbi:hypothetical protein Ndes2526B_g08768 [Nannochloris sp. 'desiccata']